MYVAWWLGGWVISSVLGGVAGIILLVSLLSECLSEPCGPRPILPVLGGIALMAVSAGGTVGSFTLLVGPFTKWEPGRVGRLALRIGGVVAVVVAAFLVVALGVV